MRCRLPVAAFIAGLVLVSGIAGCSSRELDSEARSRLDSLDATSVVRTYFESGDPAVELYLSTPHEVSVRKASNYVSERERIAGIDNLAISGGGPGGRDIVGAEDYGDVRQFFVEYDSRKRSSIGEPPGDRAFFVYTGTDPESGRVKVIGVGTGP
jgi:hypothetical protein